MQVSNSELDYSIVICTYNPEARILKRCLHAVSSLDRQGLNTEVILVDNNSEQPVMKQAYIEKFLHEIPQMRIIHVAEPGVQFARMAAIRDSGGKYIVYIDTDNEPAPDYLQQLKMLNSQYPEVAAWGPGDVTVDFLDGIDRKLENFARGSFQEKHYPQLAFDNKPLWQTCYPVGTGLCTFGFILKEYVKEAERGRFSLPGRKGELLSSGEDTQMILLAISKGFSAGSSPSLKLKHLIPGSRANVSYIRRLIFGTASCYETCLLEVFPMMESRVKSKTLSPATFVRKSFKKFVQTGMGTSNSKTFHLIEWLGLQAGCYFALNIPMPRSVQWLIKYLKAT